MQNFMKIRQVGADLLCVTDRHEEANSLFRNL
jgi:hypothetical protein